MVEGRVWGSEGSEAEGSEAEDSEFSCLGESGRVTPVTSVHQPSSRPAAKALKPALWNLNPGKEGEGCLKSIYLFWLCQVSVAACEPLVAACGI